MNEAILQTIEFMRGKVRAAEDEAARLKGLVNTLAKEAGVTPPYADVQKPQGDLSTIRNDQFYGQPLMTAIRTVLDMRKNSGMGAASVGEIHASLKAGGYKFDAKDEDNEKATVRMSLRKNPTVFHKIPTGDFGLLAWYPNAKPAKEDEKDNGKPKGPQSDLPPDNKSGGEKPTGKENEDD